MMREARDLIVRNVAELGIQIVDVRILRTDLTQDVSQQTFERMKAERLAEAAFLRARGQEAAQSLARHRRPSGGRDRRRGTPRQRNPPRRGRRRRETGSSRRPMGRTRSSSSSTARCRPTGRRSDRRARRCCCRPTASSSTTSSADSQNGEAPAPAAPNGIAPLTSSTLSVPVTTDVPVETNPDDLPRTAAAGRDPPISPSRPRRPHLPPAASRSGPIAASLPPRSRAIVRPATIKSPASIFRAGALLARRAELLSCEAGGVRTNDEDGLCERAGS